MEPAGLTRTMNTVKYPLVGTRCIAAVFTVVLLTAAVRVAPAVADEKSSPYIDHRFGAQLGAFLTSRDTRIRLDSDIGLGTEINLESDLGLESSTEVGRFDMYWRFKKRHRLDFNIFDLSRSGISQLTIEIDYMGTIFEVGTTVASNFDLTIYELSYAYLFYDRPRTNIYAHGGLFINDMKSRIQDLNTDLDEESSELTAPLPVFGLSFDHALAEKTVLSGSAGFFALNYGDYGGRLTDLQLTLDYYLSERFALGLGFNYVDVDVDISKDSWRGHLDWAFAGGMIFFKYSR